MVVQAVARHPARVADARSRRSRGAVLAGVGLAGTLDEVVLHQLLRWHHLVDRGDPALGRISDGVFHVLSTVALVAGVVLLARSWDGDVRRALSGVLIGLGGFNVFDGTVNHKLLGLHQVREGVPDLLPYDLGFLGLAVTMLAAGLLLRPRSPAPA